MTSPRCHRVSCHFNYSKYQESDNSLGSCSETAYHHSFLKESVKGPSDSYTESYLFPMEKLKKKKGRKRKGGEKEERSSKKET